MEQLSPQELVRYSRQMVLPDIGEAGQVKLKNARILLVGAGGLGSSPAIYLAAAGVGTLGIIDSDIVSLSNLHRQVLHYTCDIDKPKVSSAAEKLQAINPLIKTVLYQQRLSVSNALEICSQYDVIIDGTDNLPSRYLINDACFFLKKPFIFGGVFQFEGQCCIFAPQGPCYRCFFREMPQPQDMPSCSEAGVFGTIPGIIGLIQANEAIKWICKIGQPLSGRLVIFDALTFHWREIKIKKSDDCPLCGSNPSIHDLQEYSWSCLTPHSKDSMEITVQQLKKLRDQHPDLYILDVREQDEWDQYHIEGSHLKPLSNFAQSFHEVPKGKTIYCLCKMGGRSARAADFLRSKGYSDVVNIQGGIMAWADFND